MRILHFVHHYPPELLGGTQSYVSWLAEHQAAEGHEVAVVTGAGTHRPGALERETRNGVGVLRIYRDLPAESHSGQLGSERIGGLVAEELERFRPDVCHVHHWDGLSNDLVRRVRAAGSACVVTLHDLFTSCARFFRMPDARSFCAADVTFADCARCLLPDAGGTSVEDLEQIVRARFAAFQDELRAADVVFVLGEAQRKLLASVPGYDFDGFEVLPIGIPAGTVERAADWKPEPGRLRLINWAGLDPRKGIHVLLEAVAASDSKEAFEVHLFGREGNAEYVEELRRLASGLDVRFHGPFEDADRATFGSLADVAVFPFLAFETYGLVVDEALCSGLCVIVPDHGAPMERVAGKGFAVRGGDVAGLSSTLEWLLDQPEEVERMRAAEPRLWPLEEHAERLAEHYRSISAGRP